MRKFILGLLLSVVSGILAFSAVAWAQSKPPPQRPPPPTAERDGLVKPKYTPRDPEGAIPYDAFALTVKQVRERFEQLPPGQKFVLDEDTVALVSRTSTNSSEKVINVFHIPTLTRVSVRPDGSEHSRHGKIEGLQQIDSLLSKPGKKQEVINYGQLH